MFTAGILATQGRVSNGSHLLPDAVFMSDDLSSSSAVSSKTLRSQIGSISFLQPSENGGMASEGNSGTSGAGLMQMYSMSGGSTANSSFTTSNNTSFTSTNGSFTNLNSVFTAPNSSSGQDQLYGSLRTLPVSVAGNMSSSGIPADVLRCTSWQPQGMLVMISWCLTCSGAQILPSTTMIVTNSQLCFKTQLCSHCGAL